MRGAETRLDPDRPVPLVSYGEQYVYHRLAVTALMVAGMDWEDIFTGPSITSLDGAVAAGLGVMAITRELAIGHGMMIWENGPLPKLPELHSGIYIRECGACDAYEQLADEIATVLRVPFGSAPRLALASDTASTAA